MISTFFGLPRPLPPWEIREGKKVFLLPNAVFRKRRVKNFFPVPPHITRGFLVRTDKGRIKRRKEKKKLWCHPPTHPSYLFWYMRLLQPFWVGEGGRKKAGLCCFSSPPNSSSLPPKVPVFLAVSLLFLSRERFAVLGRCRRCSGCSFLL